MRFDTPATTNPIDQLKVVGKPVDRIEGRLKITGAAPYAYEQNDAAPDAAYGYVVGSAIAKGRIQAISTTAAGNAAGVLGVLTFQNAGALAKGSLNTARLLGGPDIEHYHQALALVIAETFEQARAAAQLVDITYAAVAGAFDLERAKASGQFPASNPGDKRTGDFEGGYLAAPVKLDATYTTPDQSHAMMEPHATIALWKGTI